MDSFQIHVDTADLEALADRYGAAAARALQITQTYTQKLQREARRQIESAGRVDTGRLVQAIQPATRAEAGSILGTVSAGTKYARFIHEGAMHQGDGKIVPHFVPFSIAPSLLLWAKRNKVVYQKEDKWYFKGKSGKEYRINIKKGGLMVKQEPVKFFEAPFEQLAPAYFNALKEAF